MCVGHDGTLCTLPVVVSHSRPFSMSFLYPSHASLTEVLRVQQFDTVIPTEIGSLTSLSECSLQHGCLVVMIVGSVCFVSVSPCPVFLSPHVDVCLHRVFRPIRFVESLHYGGWDNLTVGFTASGTLPTELGQLSSLGE